MRWQWEDLSVAWYIQFWQGVERKGLCGFLDVSNGIYADMCLENKNHLSAILCEMPKQTKEEDDSNYLFDGKKSMGK